jgi:hypothetical protein
MDWNSLMVEWISVLGAGVHFSGFHLTNMYLYDYVGEADMTVSGWLF